MHALEKNRLTLPRLYAVTDQGITSDDALLGAVAVVLDAGVRMLQVRFKSTPVDRMLELGKKLRRLTREAGALLIVNDHPQVALEIRADGVHLGKDDPDVEQARAMLGPGAVIGVSAYDSLERVVRFGPGTISYLGMSSPYGSPLKKHKALPSMEAFSRLVSRSKVPVYGIGGIVPARVKEMLAAGCHGVAAVSAIFASDDPAGAVRAFTEALERT